MFEKTKELLKYANNWLQDGLGAVNSEGQDVSPYEDEAVKWSLLGAIYLELITDINDNEDLENLDYLFAMKLQMVEEAIEAYTGKEMSVVEFNNEYTFEDLHHILDMLIYDYTKIH